MRFHQLTLHSIGSYAGEATINFDELSQDGLFMVFGNTGAGKSIILDAVIFALFGTKGTGELFSKDRILSLYNRKKAAAWVKLVFSHDGVFYRLKRQASGGKPSFEKDVSLDFDHPEVIEDKTAEVISKLLGLDSKQFTQTVILQQGEVERFLKSNNTERTKLLESLFGAEIFEKITELAKDHSKTAQEASKNFQTEQLALARTLLDKVSNESFSANEPWQNELNRFQQLDLEAPYESIGESLIQLATFFDDTSQALFSQAETQSDEAERAKTQAEKDRDAAKKLRSEVQSAKEYQQELEQLESHAETMRLLDSANQRAEKAIPVVNASEREQAQQRQAHKFFAELLPSSKL